MGERNRQGWERERACEGVREWEVGERVRNRMKERKVSDAEE